MTRAAHWVCFFGAGLIVVVAGCGDGDGDGTTSTSSTSSTSTTTTGSGGQGGGDARCTELEVAREAALEAAQACTASNTAECVNAEGFCCPVLIANPSAAAGVAYLEAHQAYLDAGCFDDTTCQTVDCQEPVGGCLTELGSDTGLCGDVHGD